MSKEKSGKVVGVGGIFFKSEAPAALREWYRKHLGLPTDEYGALFSFEKEPKPTAGHLQWSPFPKDTDYFSPSDKNFMINFRVQNLEALAAQLRSAEVRILDEIETFSYGKFLHILDPEGNKIELWEPTPNAFSDSEE